MICADCCERVREQVADASPRRCGVKPIWTKENGGVKCWVEARPDERGGRYRILLTTPDKPNPGNGYPYEREADAVRAAEQTFGAFDAIYNKQR